jgi:hypothetical protein
MADEVSLYSVRAVTESSSDYGYKRKSHRPGDTDAAFTDDRLRGGNSPVVFLGCLRRTSRDLDPDHQTSTTGGTIQSQKGRSELTAESAEKCRRVRGERLPTFVLTSGTRSRGWWYSGMTACSGLRICNPGENSVSNSKTYLRSRKREPSPCRLRPSIPLQGK